MDFPSANSTNSYQIQKQQCYICCQQQSYFVLPPCNHRHMCWKCCIKLIDGSIFSCPFCKSSSQSKSIILFVDLHQMKTQTFQSIIQKGPYKSKKNSFYLYSNQNVAHFLEAGTSFACRFCSQIFESVSFLKKHLKEIHRRQFCQVCLQNRKCLLSQQTLFSDTEIAIHQKQGQYSQYHQLTLYHPYCSFCKIRYYDAQQFKYHLRTSSHLQCETCQKISQKFKYVYYKDYPQIQRHFQKSHFLCTQGMCVGKKFQNVFATQGDLDQHRNRVHKKNRTNVKVQSKMGIPSSMLGFHQNQNEAAKNDQLQWDKIGKNFNREFQILNKTFKLQKQVHKDMLIDIREFYDVKIKQTINLNLDQIIHRYSCVIQMNSYKVTQVHINTVDLFKPMQMPPLTRVQLQKFIQGMFETKFCRPIIQIFFTRRNQFFKLADYFEQLKNRMSQFSPIAYYFAFPQLIRFMKDQNTVKRPMDQFYSQSLQKLKVNKIFVFHQKNTYSDMLIFIRNLVEECIKQKLQKEQLNIQIYLQFLKDMNINFYNDHHSQLFYVQKDKITNLYHMIDKCKTQDILKMNWLLKVGLSKNSFDLITKKFYFKTVDHCLSVLQKLTIQQLALIYSYTKICLEVLFQKNQFSENMLKSKPLFLNEIIKAIKQQTVSSKLKDEIIKAETKSLKLQVKHVEPKNKGIILNDADYPSLIEPVSQDSKKDMKNKNDPLHEIIFGRQRLPIWDQQNAAKKKRNKIVATNKKQQDEQYPSLHGKGDVDQHKQNVNATKKTRKKGQRDQADDQEDFPVFQYKPLSSNQKSLLPQYPPQNDNNQAKTGKSSQCNKKNKKSQNLATYIGKTKFAPDKWDQDKSRQNFNKKNQKQQEKKQRKNQKSSNQSSDEQLRRAIQQSKISFKKEALKQMETQSKKIQKQRVNKIIERRNDDDDDFEPIQSSKKNEKKNIQADQDNDFQPINSLNNKIKKQQTPSDNNLNANKETHNKKKKDKNKNIDKNTNTNSNSKKQEQKQTSSIPKIQQKKIQQPIKSKKFKYDDSDDDFPILSQTKNQNIKKQDKKQNSGDQICYYQIKRNNNIKIRADMTDSQEQKRIQKKKKQQEQQQYKKKKFNINEEDFMPLGSEPQISIVNKLITQGSKPKEEISKQVKKNRKGKATVIEKVNIFELP